MVRMRFAEPMVMSKETLRGWNLSDFDSNPSKITFGTFILLELIFDILSFA